ncbi:hypothetical protein [Nitrolancea hollandica]|uniref:PIN domain-containing protein n=1 Tax=Nitrolancea hollandica Lb TaxID=1129897 RepID=I4EHQ0_9BACT|nr:hypothetical protein [Nitrolancea hollandica]CCF84212.1 hypothetical protein NITHO_3210020 [Nitrolancea hollandica Lb]
MTDGLIVETNWIVDLTLRRSSASQTIWEAATRNEVTLFLPSICVAESVKLLERLQSGWRSLAAQLERDANEIRRYGALAGSAKAFEGTQVELEALADQTEHLFWQTLEQVSQCAELLVVGYEIIRHTRNIREQLELTPADAAVLATVVTAKEQGLCARFFSRDKKAFGKPPTFEFMREMGILYHFDLEHCLRSIRGG